MAAHHSLFLLPVGLGDSPLEQVLPAGLLQKINEIDTYLVENVRTARRFLSKADIQKPIDDLRFLLLNKRTSLAEKSRYLTEIKHGSLGLMSEAGNPGIADPGADIVRMAHERGIRVVPYVGPSSILLAQMASGLNGQSFAFSGYLPIDKNERTKRIKQLETRAVKEGQSQSFMEAPYRNMALLNDILATCRPETRLCIAADITLETEFIRTQSIRAWRKKLPELHKRPAIFILGR